MPRSWRKWCGQARRRCCRIRPLSVRTLAAALAIAIAVGGGFWLNHGHAQRPVLVATSDPPVSKAPRTPGPKSPLPASAARIGEIPGDLAARRLTIPVQGVKAADLRPSFFDVRGQHAHEAIDIMAPRGQPVIAVEDGAIAKLFISVPGGVTIYQFDPAEKYAYYYAHLDHYADSLRQGGKIRRGQVIGYVGSTGDADPAHPHLHFAIFRLGPEKQWWKGEALDPYPALIGR